uniref:Ig-like domain-containing protein n=1 Tax=Gouania willdenowi TaxID=441366 RepID=A0A8C5GPG9_GOUWI
MCSDFTLIITSSKVTQPPGDVILTQGQTATLNCTFTTIDSDPYLFWYKQEVNSYPKFILRRSRYSADNSPEFVKDRFDAELKDSSVPLMIQDLHVCDSAVYYFCLCPSKPCERHKTRITSYYT